MENASPKQIKNTQLHPYQQRDLTKLFERIEQRPGSNLLYQLPTGGGKTVIFSAIAANYLEKRDRKVIVLTHRIELCKQTSATLKKLGIKNTVITSDVKKINRKDGVRCYVAMVETLKNRIRDGLLNPAEIGLAIIDEAHHNSFHKLLKNFTNATVIGVTATPLSSDITLPLNKNYGELVLGENIESLIGQGFLAQPKTYRYDVELHTLQTAHHGDYTVRTSDELYSSPAMLDLLRHAYEQHARNKKTLIFNNGVFTSRNVSNMLNEAGYPCRHLDHKTSSSERTEILAWFKKTKGAILTSVSILTVGFDEPSIQTVILNRATNSLTLFHQMIGRGSRRLPKKKTFSIIDLGNNTDRFGNWETPVDWQYIFNHPEAYLESIASRSHEAHAMPSDVRSQFGNTLELAFDVQSAYNDAIENGLKPKTVIRDSLRQHALMCISNADTIEEAQELAKSLEKEIAWRVKQYSKCLGKVTKSYTEWLLEDYKSKLDTLIRKLMHRMELKQRA